MVVGILLALLYYLGVVGTIGRLAHEQIESEGPQPETGFRWKYLAEAFLVSLAALFWFAYWPGRLLGDVGSQLLLPPPAEPQ